MLSLRRTSLSVALVVAGALALASGASAVPASGQDRPHHFEVAPGVHAFIPAGGGSTATVVISGGEALVVDPHSTAAQAEALAAEIRGLGSVEVRWVVNSHWHQDHHGGTTTLLGHWPDALVLRHPRADEGIATFGAMERPIVARMRGGEGGDVIFAPADRLVDRPLVLHLGELEVEVRPTAPAHTSGDLFVWIPERRVLVAGDLSTSPYVVPRSGFPRSYARVLRGLAELPFEHLIPGHGMPQENGRQRLLLMADFLQTVAEATDEQASEDPALLAELGASLARRPEIARFEERIPWQEELAMRFLEFPDLVHMTAMRALAESRDDFVGHDLEAGYVPVDGARIYYEQVGRGEPVVLIHGGFMDARMWDGQFVALAAAGHRVVRYDLPGFGRTVLDDRSAPRSDSADLAALLDGLEIDSAHLVGLSMGGTVAIDFAVEYPDRVRSLVAAETRPSGMVLPEARMQEMRAIFELAGEGRRQAAIEALLEHPLFARAADEPEARNKIRRLVEDNFTAEFLTRADVAPAIDRLARIAAPTLLLQGAPADEDADRIAALMRESIGDLRVVRIPDAGHMLNLERPGRFNELVLEFLSASRVDTSE